MVAMARAAKAGAVGADTAAAEPGGHEATAAADHAAAAEVTEENGGEADRDGAMLIDPMLIDPHQADLGDVAALTELDRRLSLLRAAELGRKRVKRPAVSVTSR